MPPINKPSEQEYQSYIGSLREKPNAFAFKPEERKAMLQLLGSLRNYAASLDNPEDKAARLSLLQSVISLQLMTAGTSNDVQSEKNAKYLKNIYNLKPILSAAAANGKSHFENMMDYAYANNVSKQNLRSSLNMLSDRCGLDLQPPETKRSRIEDAPSAEAGPKKSALAWISDYKKAAIDVTVGKLNQADWIVNCFAVRSLADSVRHQKGSLIQQFTEGQIRERAERLLADKHFSAYIDTIKYDTEGNLLTNSANLLLKGNGGRLEDQFTAYMLKRGSFSHTELCQRYRPTAKQLISCEQARLSQKLSPAERDASMAKIIAARQLAGAEPDSIFGFGSAKLDDKLNLTKFEGKTLEVGKALGKLPEEERSALRELASKGKGGKLESSYNETLDDYGIQQKEPAPKPKKAAPVFTKIKSSQP